MHETHTCCQPCMFLCIEWWVPSEADLYGYVGGHGNESVHWEFVNDSVCW